MKNPFGRTVTVDSPHRIFKAGSWEWRVLKTYETPEKEAKNPLARWFCAVKSPNSDGVWQYGDVYVSEVKSLATEITVLANNDSPNSQPQDIDNKTPGSQSPSRTYRLMINGRHYKSCIGVVPHKMYRYFQERNIHLEGYIEAWLNDGGEEFEEEHGVLPQPTGGEDVYEASGPLCEECNQMCIVDTVSQEILWSSDCSEQALTAAGVSVELISKRYLADCPTGSVVFFYSEDGAGVPFSGTFECKTEFTPSNLMIQCKDADGTMVIEDIRYGGELISNTELTFRPKCQGVELIVLPSGPLQDLTFVLSGTLTSMTRREARSRIKAAGGKVSGVIGKTTDYLIAGADAGEMLDKARELGIPILTEADFLQRLTGAHPEAE